MVMIAHSMGLSQGVEPNSIEVYRYEHLNSMQTVSIHIFSASTVLPCTANSRYPYSSTSSWVLINFRLPSLIWIFGIFWIFRCLLGLLDTLPLGRAAMFKAPFGPLLLAAFWKQPRSVKVVLIGKGSTFGKALRQRV